MATIESMTTIPEDYKCPISLDIMVNPYIHSCGRTFDLVSITTMIAQGTHTCPFCRTVINIGTNFFPNLQLKSLIEEYNGKTNLPSKISTSVTISTPINVNVFTNKDLGLININTPKTGSRNPVHICCVVDVSGSMATETVLKQGGTEVRNGLSRLDLVKHTLNTIISSLEDHDIFSLVTFTTYASVELSHIEMTKFNKSSVLAKVNSLRPEASTNIWDGLRAGLEIMYKHRTDKVNSSIFLLTDGCPNMDPPMGYSKSLQDVKRVHSDYSKNGFVCNINTFGYGYDLNSELLKTIADIGEGTYNFIPDASFVGTIFINALTNLMMSTVYGVNITVNFTDMSSTKTNIGIIMQEQERNIIFHTAGKTVNNIVVQYQHFMSKQFNELVVGSLSGELDIKQYVNDYVRTEFTTLLSRAILTHNTTDLRDFVQTIKSNYELNIYLKDLLTDIEGECLMAFKPEYFDTWGKHYLLSLYTAHNMQLRNNFKDPGVQHYCNSELYELLREHINTVFNSLPAPKPSVAYYSSHNTYQPVASLSSYNMSSNGCFAHDSRVIVLNSTNNFDIITKKLSELKIGDMVAVDKSPYQFTRVKHIVVTRHDHTTPIKMVKFDTLVITPYHPIIFEDKWVFPQTLVERGYAQEITYCEDVYNLVLESMHQVIVSGSQCITLGHGIENDPVASHEYFGTEQVIHDIEKLPVVDGRVYLDNSKFIRDSVTFKVIGYSF